MRSGRLLCVAVGWVVCGCGLVEDGWLDDCGMIVG